MIVIIYNEDKKNFFFSQSNASNDGEYVFFTGQQNSQDFARVDTWNGSRSVVGTVAFPSE